jgi:hypothetical protein
MEGMAMCLLGGVRGSGLGQGKWMVILIAIGVYDSKESQTKW